MGRGKILVVDDTKLICRMIRDKLAAAGYDVAEAYDGPEGLKKAKSFGPEVMILDIMMPGTDGYTLTRALRKDPQTAETPILILTAKSGIQEKIAGFEAGADDYITKPFDPTELELRVRALLTRAQAGRAQAPVKPGGQLIAVFSLRGGTGVSSLAANLAVSLAQMFEVQVPLVDLSLENGTASLLLDLAPKFTLVTMAQEENALDDDLLDQYLIRHASGVRLLAAPATPALSEFVKPRLLHQLLPLLRERYPTTVVDLPHHLGDLSLAVLDQADPILVVVPPDMASVKSASAALDTFFSLGYPRDKVLIVINWVFPRRGLGQKEIDAALGSAPVAVLPYDTETLVRAMNEGVPAVLAQPNAPWSQRVEGLAYRLAPAGEKARADQAGLPHYVQVKKRANGA